MYAAETGAAYPAFFCWKWCSAIGMRSKGVAQRGGVPRIIAWVDVMTSKNVGIKGFASSIPNNWIETKVQAERLGLTSSDWGEEAGFTQLARRFPGQDASDLCVSAAFELFKSGSLELGEIDCMVVVTQNPDGYGIPHTAALVQRKLGVSNGCASFDIGLGGSGYVYGLSVVRSFMESNGLRCGLLFTADPYSRIIDDTDAASALRFGDAGTVTVLTDRPRWKIGRFDFGASAQHARAMEVRLDLGGTLQLDVPTVRDVALEHLPRSIDRALKANKVSMDDIDRILVHQAGHDLLRELRQRLGAEEKLQFHAGGYGDTVSSSIPLVLQNNLDPADRCVAISGFGTGLSWASTILTKVD